MDLRVRPVSRDGLGSARVSRPRRNVGPKVSPFAHETFGRRRGSVGDRPQRQIGYYRGSLENNARMQILGSAWVSRPLGSGGSPDPAGMSDRRSLRSLTRPSVGGVARSETGHNGKSDIIAGRWKTTPACKSGSARVSRPRRNVRPKVSPFAHETFGRRRGSVGDRPQRQIGYYRGPLENNARIGFGAGLPTPPERPTEGLSVRSRDLRFGGVARSETGHNGKSDIIAGRWKTTPACKSATRFQNLPCRQGSLRRGGSRTR